MHPNTIRAPYQNQLQLQYLNMTTLTNGECRDRLSGSGTEHLFRDSMMCTKRDNATGLCTSDYGGALIVDGILVGVFLYETGICAGSLPEVFTRVSSFVEWIDENLSKDNGTGRK